MNRIRAIKSNYTSTLRYMMFILLISISAMLYSQQDSIVSNIIYIPKGYEVAPEQKESGKTYIHIDTNPRHEGISVQNLINSTMKFPESALQEKVQGNTVRVQFTLETDGRIHNAVIITSASPSLDRETMRVIHSLPRFSPGILNDEAVPVEYICQLTFNEVVRPQNVLETTGFWLPEYKGGDKALNKYLQQNMKYPTEAAENAVQGLVLLRFTVSSEGKVIKPKVLRKVSPECDAEAVRVVMGLTEWLPGVNNGKYVSCYFTLSIRFSLGV